ncbi:MAG: sulfotransferase family protein [Desulfosalsimonas sp.]
MSGPVYLIASERSGTNFLRTRLTGVQGVYYGPSAPHFLKHLYYSEPFFGNLSDDQNFHAFIKDALALCYLHFAPWDIDFDADALIAAYGDRKRTAVYFADFLFEQYAARKGYKSYFCKDNFIYEFALDIAEKIPGTKFIYLYRDPRDFVLSQMKRPNAARSVINYARLWEYEQVKSIRVATELKDRSRCLWVSYESLVRDEEKELRRICDFMGVKMDKAFNNSIDDNVIVPVTEWSNLSKKTMKQNYNKFLNELSAREIRLIEAICQKPMAFLKYESTCGKNFKMQIQKADYLTEWMRRVFLSIKNIYRRKRNIHLSPIMQKRYRHCNKIDVNYRAPL